MSTIDTVVGDLLRAATTDKPFDEDDRTECRVAEAHLRDILRAPVLAASEVVMTAVNRARRRGCVVMLLDDRHEPAPILGLVGEIVDGIVSGADQLAAGESMTLRIHPEGRMEHVSLVTTSTDPSCCSRRTWQSDRV